jgi:hypothetical protein
MFKIAFILNESVVCDVFSDSSSKVFTGIMNTVFASSADYS